jgi:hypothetical protein
MSRPQAIMRVEMNLMAKHTDIQQSPRKKLKPGILKKGD